MTFGWPVWLAALAALAAGLPPAPADAGLLKRAQPAAARTDADGAYRQLNNFGRVFEGLAEGSAEDKFRALDLFAEVFHRIQSRYWRRIEPKALIDAAIAALREQKSGAPARALGLAAVRGMIASLDPYSEFTAKKRRANRSGRAKKKRGANFGNIGLELFMRGGVAVVISPHDASPASRAGIRPGDIITGVDGIRFANPALGDVLDRLRGPVGSEVRLQVMRPGGKAFEARMVRSIAPGRTVRARLDGNVAVIRIASFAAHTTRDLRQRLKELRAEAVARAARIEAVVLDLRNNSGGLLNQAISGADVFLDSGEIVSTRAGSAAAGTAKHRRFNARLGDALRGRPVAVVINGGSASAAEIVAGALQDLKRAIVVGERSFGKGSVQTVMQIKGFGSLRLTTSHYYSPSGRSFDDAPIQPDVGAKACKRLTGASLRPGEDALIACALKSVRVRARIGRRRR